MTVKKGLFFVFAVIIILVPVYIMVSAKEVLNYGNSYKFKPMTDNPFDTYSGEFLRANYETNGIPTRFDFDEGETAYVSISVDEEDCAFFDEAFKKVPEGRDYVKTTVKSYGVNVSLQEEIEMAMESDNFDLQSLDTRGSVNIKIPDQMNQFFINEDDALRAEEVFRKEQENIHIGVRILDGEVRLEDIYVFDKPILEYLDAKK